MSDIRPIWPLLYSFFLSFFNISDTKFLGTVLHIGVGRFRTLGGPRGSNSQQAHDVVMTSMRRYDVASTSFRCHDVASTSLRRHVPTRFLTNQCQIIKFLILKSDIIENSRIELRGIVLPLPSNQIKVIFIVILPFYLIRL